MLSSLREFHSLQLGAHYVNYMLLHSKFRLLINERRGIIEDDTLLFSSFSRRLEVDRSEFVLCLEGELRVRRPGFEAVLRPGDWIGENRQSGWYFRRETQSAALILEWEPGLLGTRHIPLAAGGRIAPATFAAVRNLASLLPRTREQELAAPLLRQLLGLLRSEGLPFDDVEEGALVEEVPEFMRTLVRTVDAALSDLSNQPMLIDLQDAMGCSRPQILSHIRDFNERYAFHAAGGWRDVLQRWRMSIGIFLMSVEGATTEEVAGMLGYSSPNAFCHAFANRGLPSPGALRETLLRLG